MIPILAADSNNIAITKHIVESIESIDGLSELAGGIGAVFLLVVIFYYITAILDGGKFQIKMLMPVLIYVLTCNFALVREPVSAFTDGIQSTLCKSLTTMSENAIVEAGGEADDNLLDIFNLRKNERMTKTQKELDEEWNQRIAGQETPVEIQEDGSNSISETELDSKIKEKKNLFLNVIESIKTAISQLWHTMIQNLISSFSRPAGTAFGLIGLLAAVLSWICSLMAKVLTIFGGVMTGIITAFGPITFAFSVFPGRGKNIMTWFIRLCQYSLWAPICCLIQFFTVRTSIYLADAMAAGSGSGMLVVCAVMVCNIVALTSVPTISQMILEGAGGNVSLTGGLQAMAASLTNTVGVAAQGVATVGAVITGRAGGLSGAGGGGNNGSAQGLLAGGSRGSGSAGGSSSSGGAGGSGGSSGAGGGVNSGSAEGLVI